MRLMLKPLSRQVVVITGASSGIGLATARAAARRGAKVVLTARSAATLRAIVDGIERDGGEAIHVVADVGRVDELAQVATAAIARFGRIDTWINNAGVDILGAIAETSEADMRRLFDTNFWGTVNGSRIAIEHLRQRGGALINIGSLESDRAVPLQGIYSASKHAVKGFTDALRVELMHEKAPIAVTLIKPGAIGTPIPQHTKSIGGHEPKLPPPIYTPEDAAAVILRAAVHATRDAFVGGAASFGSFVSQALPAVTDWISSALLVDSQLGRTPATAGDNLHGGRAEGATRGDHQGRTIRPSLYSNLAIRPALAMAGMGLALIGVAAAVMRRRSA